MKFRLERRFATYYLYAIGAVPTISSAGEQLIGTYTSEESAMDAAARFKEQWELMLPDVKVFEL